MDEAAVEEALTRAEAAVAIGASLEGTGFWRAVGQARRSAAVAARYAEWIGRIDRQAFQRGVRLRAPAPVGTSVLTALSGAGLAAILLAEKLDSRWLRSLVFLAGFGAIELGTHSLAHWAVGRAMGMRFTHYFLGGPPPPRPGAKLDYASYLRVAPKKRAAMHASGAVVTKIVPFALIPAARSMEVHGWVVALLVVVGMAQIVTDVLFSTKSSDWKKVRRELRAAATWRAPG